MKDTILSSWKEIGRQDSNVNNNLHILDHQVIKGGRFLSASKELYSIL